MLLEDHRMRIQIVEVRSQEGKMRSRILIAFEMNRREGKMRIPEFLVVSEAVEAIIFLPTLFVTLARADSQASARHPYPHPPQ